MSEKRVFPCRSWAKRLGAYHSNELSPDERAQVEVHLHTCDSCAIVLREYQQLDEQLHHMLSNAPAPAFTAKMLPDRKPKPAQENASSGRMPALYAYRVISGLASTLPAINPIVRPARQMRAWEKREQSRQMSQSWEQLPGFDFDVEDCGAEAIEEAELEKHVSNWMPIVAARRPIRKTTGKMSLPEF